MGAEAAPAQAATQPNTKAQFVHLHNHSHYSLLYFIGHADGFEEGVMYVVLPDETDGASA